MRPGSVLHHLGAGTQAIPEPEPVAARPTPSQMPPLSWQPSVLLVEDNDINALLARCLLEKAGCTITHARNGRIAVDWMQEVTSGARKPFDIILMDAHMPVLDGLEATRLIKEMIPKEGIDGHHCPPIVAVTANAFDEDRRRCLAAGMDDYLAKPFELADLHAILERWKPALRSAA